LEPRTNEFLNFPLLDPAHFGKMSLLLTGF
jgi:hypothetical protein